MHNLKPCKFTFDDTKAFDGFSHGSTWNGFDNVAVTPQVRDEIVAYFKDEFGDNCEDMQEIPVGDDGLVSLGWGFSTQIVRKDDNSGFYS